MNKSALAVWVTFGLACGAVSAVDAASAEAPVPPVAQRRPFDVISPNGNRRDDYYWLRDDTRKSKDVLDYLEAENAYRDAYMAPSEKLTQKLYDELVARLKPDDASVPVFERGYFYYSRFVPGLDYAVYVRRKGAMTAPEEVLLDGNAMAHGHSFFQIGDTEVSPDGTLLAYTEDDLGRRQYTLRVKNLKTGETLSDRVENVQPQFVWAADNRTLVYVEKDPVTLLSVRVRKHPLGSAQPDPLVYEEKDHSYYMGVHKSRSEKFVFIDLKSTQQSEVRYAAAADPKLSFRPVLPREAELEYEVDHLGQDFIIRTNWHAPNFRIVRVPLATSADKRTWSDVIPARDDTFIEDFEVSKQYLAINERSGGLLKMRVKTWAAGKDTVIASEEPSYAALLVHTPGINSSTVRYVFSSLATPRTTYDYDMGSDKKSLQKTEAVLGGFNAANYRTEFLWVPARDGKKIPVSLVMRKGCTSMDRRRSTNMVTDPTGIRPIRCFESAGSVFSTADSWSRSLMFAVARNWVARGSKTAGCCTRRTHSLTSSMSRSVWLRLNMWPRIRVSRPAAAPGIAGRRRIQHGAPGLPGHHRLRSLCGCRHDDAG